jgi:DNA excision repair protein ERCC-2
MEVLFPYQTVRPVQAELMHDIEKALTAKKHLIAHAPTGLGKTAAALSVAVPFAIENKLTVFFLTSRHTQHAIALETLAAMKKKHGVEFDVVDLIGKMWMCSQPGVEKMYNSEFMDYCAALREDEECEFYTQLYAKNSRDLSVRAHKALSVLNSQVAVADVKKVCESHGVCPYYFSMERAKKARVIIADYYNVFHPQVRDAFFSRIGAELEKAILIVDEAHNLPERIRNVMSSRLSSTMIRNALIEAKKFGYPTLIVHLQEIQRVLNGLESVGVVSRDAVVSALRALGEYSVIVDQFEQAGTAVREKAQRSSIARIAEFLASWVSHDGGFVRYTEQKEGGIILHHACLDAGLVSADVFERAYASVVMSGTLTPPEFFRDVLGVSRAELKVYGSPFPPENRLALIVPKASTQYQLRTPAMYERIASICLQIIDAVPGNSALFFPSYGLRDEILRLVRGKCSKKLFVEEIGFTSAQKGQLLEEFKSCKDAGGALFAVAAAHFSEGIDLPGDYLKAVVVVGLPLARPDLQTNALIQYYSERFGKGWEYGYTYPALIKCLQAAGRCIRTEADRGVIIFLDHRFLQSGYLKCIPPDWNVRASSRYVEEIKEFFG